MMRNKNKLIAISDESKRKATLVKKRDALCKKVNELSILCGVDAGVIVQDLEINEEFIWPSRDYVQEQVMKFLSIPEMNRNRKMCTHDNYLLAILTKEIKNIKKIEKQNDEKEMKSLMHDLIKGKTSIQALDMKQTSGLIQLIHDKMNMVDKKIVEHELENKKMQASLSMAAPHFQSLFPMVAKPKAIKVPDIALNESMPDPKFIEDLKDDQWLTELMYDKENIAYPSFASDYGFYNTYVSGRTEGNIMGNCQSQTKAGTSSGNEMGLAPSNDATFPATGENEKLFDDLNPYLPHISFP